jgi:hypothetical protein
MIDRNSRDKLINLIDELISGHISNDEFEDALPISKDIAILEIFQNGIWYLYSDLHEHKLVDKKQLSDSDKEHVAWWLVFLKTNLEYKWPVINIGNHILSKLTFGFLGQNQQKAWEKFGDINTWPFADSKQ